MHKLIIVLTLSVLFLSLDIFSADEDEHNNNFKNRHDNNKPPSAAAKQMLQDTYTYVRRSARAQWEIAKYLINKLEIYFFPPNLDFRSRNVPDSNNYGRNSAGETITKAAGKSFQISKVAVEETAKSAARAAGETAHRTAKNMKGSSKSTGDDSHDEL